MSDAPDDTARPAPGKTLSGRAVQDETVSGRAVRDKTFSSRPVPYLDMRVGEFLRELSVPGPEPAGGSAAALTVALAAGLCAMTADLSARQLTGHARASEPVSDARQLSHQADPPARAQASDLATDARQLRDRAAALAQADAEAYGAVMAALRARDESADGALSAASVVPLEVAELGARAAALAALVARHGNPKVRGDAITAALLAAGGSRAAAELVRINLARAAGDNRPEQAQRFAAEAARHAAAATADHSAGRGA